MKKFSPCPTVREALDLLKAAEKKRDAVAAKYRSKLSPVEEGTKVPPDVPLETINAIKKAEWECERIANWLYTLPWIRPYLRPFMIDIKYGDERGFSKLIGENEEKACSLTQEEAMERIDLIEKDPKAFTAKTAGTLFTEIEKHLRDHGFHATDRGCGGCGGHIGYPCSEEERDVILSLLHLKFGQAIRSGMIATTVAWFKVRS